MRCRAEPSRLFYTHISNQYEPFSSKVVNVGVRDSTCVLDGLLHHESDLRIQEHYTDTAGFTDHVFALMHLLGLRFALRIRDLSNPRLYIPNSDTDYDAPKPMIGATLNIKQIRAHWDENPAAGHLDGVRGAMERLTDLRIEGPAELVAVGCRRVHVYIVPERRVPAMRHNPKSAAVAGHATREI